MLSEEGSELTLIACLLTDNRGGTGGGAGAGGAALYLRDCRLTGNQADFGGGIGLMSTDAVRIQDCVVEANSALFWGGGLCADDAGFTLSGGRIDANTAAGEGGAAYLLASSAMIQGCRIRNNTSAGETGGFHLEGSRLTVTGGSLTGNGTAIRVATPLADPVDARLNWWGDGSGPYHPLDNPGGLGDAVSDQVLFAPWNVETGVPAAGAGPRLTARGVRGAVELRLTLPAAGPARLSVHDAAGRRVGVLLAERMPAGERALRWEGGGDSGRPQATGLYLFRLDCAGTQAVARALLLR